MVTMCSKAALLTRLLSLVLAVFFVIGCTDDSNPVKPIEIDPSRALAFTSHQNGGTDLEIHLVSLDGSKRVNLTNRPWADRNPVWSPDASKIAFTSIRTGRWEVYTMESNGSNQQRLTTEGSEFFSWSPDGSCIAFVSNSTLSIVNADGSNQTDLVYPCSRYFSWSPDGGSIVFAEGSGHFTRNIYTVRLDGTELRQLTGEDSFHLMFRSVLWSPNGDRIAFCALDEDPSSSRFWGVWVMSLDGASKVDLTKEERDQDSPIYKRHCTAPVWSPDGAQLAFRIDEWDIGLIQADGSNARNLTNDPRRIQSHPSWSPDGRQIAYTTLAPNFRVATMNVDGTNKHVLCDGSDPCWSPLQ